VTRKTGNVRARWDIIFKKSEKKGVVKKQEAVTCSTKKKRETKDKNQPQKNHQPKNPNKKQNTPKKKKITTQNDWPESR